MRNDDFSVLEEIASRMLTVEVLEDYTLRDCMGGVDDQTAEELGVVFANGKNLNAISDIRNDEIDDAYVEMITRSLLSVLRRMEKFPLLIQILKEELRD